MCSHWTGYQDTVASQINWVSVWKELKGQWWWILGKEVDSEKKIGITIKHARRDGGTTIFSSI